MSEPGFNQSFNQSGTRTPTYQVDFGTSGQSLGRSYQPRVYGGVMYNSVQRGIQNESGHSHKSQPMHSAAKLSYQTNMCEGFRSRAYTYGANCTSAHGIEEHRNIETVDMQRATKTRICRRFSNGENCPYGDRCIFLHVYPEKARNTSAINARKTFMKSGFQVNQHCHLEQTRSVGLGEESLNSLSFRKTKMCYNWWMAGHCAYGDKCHFAHGIAELQKYQRGDNREGNRNAGCDIHSTVYRFLPNQRYASSDQPVKPLLERCLLDWKVSGKISQIYADWIEESGNEVEI